MDKPAQGALPDPLKAIRDRIDAIDEAMHRLLIERSGVIAELIAVKGTSKPGAAFRPDREADMMRRIAGRHHGDLPLATVEHIWREIIATFTAMQAPFGVVAGPSRDALALRDTLRFHFGFSVPASSAPSAEAAIGTVARSRSDVAVIDAKTEGRWWAPLVGAAAPKIMAKLPFVDMPGRPVLPAYVVGPPLEQRTEPDIHVLAMPEGGALEAAIASHGGVVAARAEGEMLVELPVAVTADDIAALNDARRVGFFFQPIRHLASRTA